MKCAFWPPLNNQRDSIQIRRVIDALDLDTILMYDMAHIGYAKGPATANTLETNNIICNYQAALLAKLHELI